VGAQDCPHLSVRACVNAPEARYPPQEFFCILSVRWALLPGRACPHVCIRVGDADTDSGLIPCRRGRTWSWASATRLATPNSTWFCNGICAWFLYARLRTRLFKCEHMCACVCDSVCACCGAELVGPFTAQINRCREAFDGIDRVHNDLPFSFLVIIENMP